MSTGVWLLGENSLYLGTRWKKGRVFSIYPAIIATSTNVENKLLFLTNSRHVFRRVS